MKRNNYKFALASKDKLYKKLLVTSPNLKIINDSFFSKEFFDYFFLNLKKFFQQSRADDKIFLSKLKKKIKIDPETLKRKLKL